MNYYIQGNKDKAEEIKAAFEAKGYDISWPGGLAEPNVINIGVERNGAKYVVAETAEYIRDLIKTHPDYKELELPVEPKFKVGDWVVKKDGTTFYGGNYAEQITIIESEEWDKRIWFSSTTWLRENDIRLWTIADAKEGDVLAINWHKDNDSWEKIIIFKNYHAKGVKGLTKGPCIEGYGNTFKNGELAFNEEVPYYSKTWTDNLQPANTKQRNLLFQKMKENGCEWDVDKKELHKIKSHYDIKNFHAGMPVLVRETSLNAWQYVLFSHCYIGGDGLTRFNAGLVGFTQCIPFNDDTKHLLGTTDPCDEQYINW